MRGAWACVGESSAFGARAGVPRSADGCCSANCGNRTKRHHDEELTSIARFALRYGVDLRSDKPDRVFLHRATEHVLARRLIAEGTASPLSHLLGALAHESWVAKPYGLDHSVDDTAEQEQPDLNERGIHVVYPVRGSVRLLQGARLGSGAREGRARLHQLALPHRAHDRGFTSQEERPTGHALGRARTFLRKSSRQRASQTIV